MPGAERAALLDAVRRGAGLLVAPEAGTEFALLDSLGLSVGRPGMLVAIPIGDCSLATDPLGALRVRTNMTTFAPDRVGDSTQRAKGRPPMPAPRTALLESDVTEYPGAYAAAADSIKRNADSTGMDGKRVSRLPTMLAFLLGSGRVVALADPDVLRTDQLRNCAMGSALGVIRGLEYLSLGGRRDIVFAEFYQGARSDGPATVLYEWLGGTALGRTLLTLIGAALILLWARGRRTLAPVLRVRDERRSALEHVDALATSWRAVRGTRTVARMLSRGIRRRHAAGRWRSFSDADFLVALAARHPAIAEDAGTLVRAITSPVGPADLPSLRTAAAHIDAECLTP